MAGKFQPLAPKLSFIGRWLLLFCSILPAQQKSLPLRSIEFHNNSYFSQRQLIDIVSLKEGDIVDSSSLASSKQRLVQMYRDEGFYAFRCDSIGETVQADSESVSLEYYLHEGPQYTLSSIHYSGNTVLSNDELRSFTTVSAGSPLQSETLESDIKRILQEYSNRGYPFAKISSDNVGIDSVKKGTVRCDLTIDEGPKVFVTEVQVNGNTVTQPDVISREFRLHKGELFNQSKLEAVRRRIDRLQLFSSVSEPQLYIISPERSDSLRGGIQITVSEGNTNTFDGILGYVPSAAPNAKGYFTGNIFIAMKNLFGTGRKAMVKWQRETEVTQEFQLQYREPWIFGVPINAGISLFQRKQDSSYVKSRIDVRVEWAITPDILLSAYGSSENVFPSANLQQFSVFESSVLSAGGEIQYDTRDDARNPTGGVLYSTTFTEGRKDITGPQKFLYLAADRHFSVQKYSVDAEMYVQTFRRQVVMLGIHGRQTTSSSLEISDLYQFGGTNSVRGYRENQFYASKLAWSNIEYRLLTGRASSFFGFVDVGYFFRPADQLAGNRSQEKSIYGYGVGARIETGLGILNVSYGLGEGDSFSNGKIHVGIANDF